MARGGEFVKWGTNEWGSSLPLPVMRRKTLPPPYIRALLASQLLTSSMLVLPTSTAPAARRRATAVAS